MRTGKHIMLQQQPMQSSFFVLSGWETAIGPMVKCAASLTYMMRGRPRSSEKHGMLFAQLQCRPIASFFGIGKRVKGLKGTRNAPSESLY